MNCFPARPLSNPACTRKGVVKRWRDSFGWRSLLQRPWRCSRLRGFVARWCLHSCAVPGGDGQQRQEQGAGLNDVAEPRTGPHSFTPTRPTAGSVLNTARYSSGGWQQDNKTIALSFNSSQNQEGWLKMQ